MPDSPADGTARSPDVYIVLDALDAPRLAAFWAAALRSQRHDTVGQYELLGPAEGQPGVVMLLQGVTDPKAGKNRMHVDLHVDDAEAEAERLVGLGARRLGDGNLAISDEVTIRWITMADPEGNEFDIGWR